MHYYSEVKTMMGNLRIGCSPKGITAISLADESRAAFEQAYLKRLGVRPQQGGIPERFERAVVKAAAGRAYAPVPLDISGLSEFQAKVLKALQKVPRGSVKTYAWLARQAGRPEAARAVGNTMARNPVPILIPCHRVVPSSGGTGNYGLGKSRKRELLSREGVAIDQLQ
jgi:methylated-DNA-[protein]-cysteine S-methyltransferase